MALIRVNKTGGDAGKIRFALYDSMSDTYSHTVAACLDATQIAGKSNVKVTVVNGTTQSINLNKLTVSSNTVTSIQALSAGDNSLSSITLSTGELVEVVVASGLASNTAMVVEFEFS